MSSAGSPSPYYRLPSATACLFSRLLPRLGSLSLSPRNRPLVLSTLRYPETSRNQANPSHHLSLSRRDGVARPDLRGRRRRRRCHGRGAGHRRRHGRRAASGHAAAGGGRDPGVGGRRAEVRAHPVPHQDVPAGGRPGGRRRHLVERRRLRLRRVAPRRVRARPPPQVLQAQQLLQLRAPAQHLRVQEDRAGQVGVRQRLLPARGEAAALRHPPPQGHAGRGGLGGGHGGSCGRSRGHPVGAARGLAGVLRRGAGAVVELVPGAPFAADAGAVGVGLRRRRRRGRGERPPAPRERAPRAGARADEEALQQHPPPHVQVRRHPAARRRRAPGRGRQGRCCRGWELLGRVVGGRRHAPAAAVGARAPPLVPRRPRAVGSRAARDGGDGARGGRRQQGRREAVRRLHRAEEGARRELQRPRRRRGGPRDLPRCGGGEGGAGGRAARPPPAAAAGVAHLPAQARVPPAPGMQRVGGQRRERPRRVQLQVTRPRRRSLALSNYQVL